MEKRRKNTVGEVRTRRENKYVKNNNEWKLYHYFNGSGIHAIVC